MPTFPHHEHLRLVNFTAFADASFDFVPGINAIIGTNGTGKTHLLKVLYACQLKYFRNKENLTFHLSGIFQTSGLDQLIRLPKDFESWANVNGIWGSHPWWFSLYETAFPVESESNLPISRPVFIPAVDMLGHTRRFVATYDEYQIDFDQTHRDIVALLLSPEPREKPTLNGTGETLSKLLGGEVEEEGERFYLRTPEGRQPMPLVGEGLRKIATLHQLIRNGHLRPGSVLFWDEPEVNLSPLLMDEVIQVLLALSRSGVQIFLTTHSYVILKELDLQAEQSDSLRFFALAPTSEGTKVETAGNFSELVTNPIMEQFDSIYDRELTRAIGPKRK